MHNERVRRVLFESCVESAAAAEASALGGADRIELCANLGAGGTTPALDEVERAAGALAVPVFAMARIRPGSFVYDANDVVATIREISALKAAGAHGIVLGALTTAGAIDIPATARLIEAARPLPVTFHRAFDDARNLDAALDALVTLGVERVLTSGGAATAPAGAATLRRLVGSAGSALTVIAGGGVRPHNVAALVAGSGVCEVHARLDGDLGSDVHAAAVLTDRVRAMIAVLSDIRGVEGATSKPRLEP